MNLNKVFVLGRMSADPETRSTPSGQNVTTLRIATNRVWNDRQSGQKQEAVEFHTVVAWGSLGDVANKYLKKGQLVFIEGRIQTRSWQAQDGQKRYRTEIVAEGLQLGPKAGGFGGSGGGSENKSGGSEGRSGKSASVAESSDEDIPVIEANTPLANPIGKEEDVEEAEIDLKDIPF